MSGDILVAHPGAASSVYELAAATAGLGRPTRFETGFYYDGEGSLARLVGRLPQPLRAKVERELRRRSFPGIAGVEVLGHPLLELAYVATARAVPTKPHLTSQVMHWRNRQFDAAVARRIRRERPAAVIGHDTSTIRAIRAARKVGTVAIVNQLIGHQAIGEAILKEEAALQPLWADSLHAGSPAWLVEQCLAESLEADHILAPSDYVRRTLLDIGVQPDRIHLLPFGVRLDRFRPPDAKPADTKLRDGKLRLIYVGQISQRKGLAYLLEALKRLADPRIELTLVGGLVGEGRGLKQYEGLYRHVRNVPHAEVARLIQQADLCVYPSLHEGSALAIMEAMACGLPAITTLNSGSLVRDGIEGYIVPIRDADEIAARIAKLRDDRTLLAALGRAARVRVEDYSWDAYRGRLGRVLDAIVPPRP